MSKKIEFENLSNTRDLGGMDAAAGKIKSGRLIRSGHLFKASKNDIKKLSGMLSVTVDLRTESECDKEPDPEIEGVKYIHLPVLSTLTPGVTREDEDRYTIEELIKSPERSFEYMCSIYESFAESKYAPESCSKFIDVLLSNENGAVLWHCTAGKDRVGFTSAVVQELLGVSRQDIYEDYLFTNVCTENEVTSLLEMFGASSEKTEKALRYLFCANEEYIDTFYKKIEELYGGFDGFAQAALGIGCEKREQLMRKYIE